MMIFERDIAIDLGTTNIRVFVRGKGIMLREPSIVAVDKYTGRMLKVGQDAQKMLGRTPANIVAIHPISAGVISDYDMTALMLKELLSRVTSFSLFKPRVLVTVPSSVTGVEERNVIDAVIEAGARKVYLVESAVATAAGAGADISKPDGHLVIDIGGGTTEVAVVSLGGVVESESIKTAGDAFDEAIVRYVRRKHNILIGKRTAEELKIGIACPFEKVKVVILGQDPYPNPGQYYGVCFSVPDGVAIPSSLMNIFKEIYDDLGKPIPSSGNLDRWVSQGVFPMNSVLTVRAHQTGSHRNRGWETFTDAVIKKLSDERENLVFMLWGSYAKAKISLIDTDRKSVV